ncbi:MAG: Hsp20/alpha crystallin family protein [Candidatus Alcyoniella australis]|nr:Hsp20/alpha crystallin family protein [Candidatus Alcyoniella australis]
MSIIRWNNNDLDWPARTLSSLLGDPFLSGPLSNGSSLLPTDIHHSEHEIVLTSEVPGLTKEEIEISVENDILTISGEKTGESQSNEQNCYCSERSYGKFERRFVLPQSVDRDKITAEVHNGLLSLTLPISEKAKPRSIEVKVS